MNIAATARTYMNSKEMMLMKSLRRFAPALFLIVLLLPGRGDAAEDASARFDALAERYFARMEGREDARALRTVLEAEAAQTGAYELWRSLFREGVAPRQGASNALALLRSLVEEGDPARLENVSGFFLPSFVPKPLAAADAVYASAVHLLRMNDVGAAELAGMLFERLLDSSRGKFFFVSTAPEEYGEIVRELSARGVLPSFGRWPWGETAGRLPLAAPVRGRVLRERAVSEGMVFLNGAGQPAPNGMYAWDRKTGRVYDVVDHERRFLLFDD